MKCNIRMVAVCWLASVAFAGAFSEQSNSGARSATSQFGNGKPATAKVVRSGKFVVKGILVDAKSAPLSNKRIFVADANDQDKVMMRVWVGEGHLKVGAGEAWTDGKGYFAIEVDRSFFEAHTMRFSIQVFLTAMSE